MNNLLLTFKFTAADTSRVRYPSVSLCVKAAEHYILDVRAEKEEEEVAR